MTDHTTQPEATLLWSDERINDLAYQMSESIRTDAFGGGERQIRGALKQVRDEYEAQLTTLQQENARLAEDKAMLQARVWELDAELAALRAEARYVPVESYQTKWRGTTLTFSRWDSGNSPVIITESDTTHIVLLPDDMRLCRLVPGQDTQPTGERSE